MAFWRDSTENYLQVSFQGTAVSHYTRVTQNYVDKVFDSKVITKWETIEIPPRSSDLTPMDLFFGGLLKDAFEDIDSDLQHKKYV